MKIFELLRRTKNELHSIGLEITDFELRELISKVTNITFEQISSHLSKELSADVIQKFNEFIDLRKTGYPTAYIIKERGFFKREFIVEEGVLIPRPETEGLVELALQKLREIKNSKEICIADLGCGTGCIGISLLMELPNTKVDFFDISEKALEITRKNISKFCLENRAETHKANISIDWLSQNPSFFGKMDLIVSNPPYIAKNTIEIDPFVKQFEPSTALFGGAKGWEMFEPWSNVAQKMLKKNGLWYSEIGFDQREVLLNLIDSQNVWRDIEVRKDLNGRDRYLLATKKV